MAILVELPYHDTVTNFNKLNFTSLFFIMSPFATALHRLSSLWDSLARCPRKVKTTSDKPSSPVPLASLPSPVPLPSSLCSPVPPTLCSPAPLPSPQTADFFFADFSDPSSSFGLPWLPFTSPRLTPMAVETEEPSTVSFEEILVTGQNRIAAYEEWCSATDVSSAI